MHILNPEEIKQLLRGEAVAITDGAVRLADMPRQQLLRLMSEVAAEENDHRFSIPHSGYRQF